MDATTPPAGGGGRSDGSGWPVPPEGLRPMLAVAAASLPAEPGWTFEPKWDGYRGIGTLGAGALHIASRRGTDMATWFPELASLADAIGGHRAVIDGELVAFDPEGRPDFAALQHRMLARRRGPGVLARTGRPGSTMVTPVLYMVFDLLGLDGRLLLNRPWAERRARLEALDLHGPAWRTSPSFPDQGPQVWAATGQQDLEGVVAKRVASPYRPGRRHPDWRKKSHEQQGLFLIGGYLPGAAGVQQLLVGARLPDGGLRHVATVEAGLVASSRRRLAARLAELHTGASPFAGPISPGPWGARSPRIERPVWVRPELAVRIAYHGTEGRQLRHPRYAGLA
jgi:bifunctional non-homologous end joining protein LigD